MSFISGKYTPTIAVLIPCYNEQQTIAKVVDDFARELPDAAIYVYDNNSTDDTAQIASQHGAIVRHETRQGKGNVMRQMFRDIDADYYVLVDGDDTYPALAVHALLVPLMSGDADMTVGDRLSNGSYTVENKREFHNFGNNLVSKMINLLYHCKVADPMSGYRAFTKTFVKCFPILAQGFEIETSLTIHSVDKNWRMVEVPIDYRDRPAGSFSKLSTFRDGFRVLRTIMSLFKDYKPLRFFAVVGLILVVIGLILGISVAIEFFQTGYVQRFPTLFVAIGLILCGLLSVSVGLILDTVVKNGRNQYELDVMRVYDEDR
ncbi:MAG: glycosyltransferase [Coriobacteriales bacterium]|jgi:glycosyltransferase involved in cell wall biosynthesis|nr:glycosyltransferase [Coriobacteriales bacterium]